MPFTQSRQLALINAFDSLEQTYINLVAELHTILTNPQATPQATLDHISTRLAHYADPRPLCHTAFIVRDHERFSYNATHRRNSLRRQTRSPSSPPNPYARFDQPTPTSTYRPPTPTPTISPSTSDNTPDDPSLDDPGPSPDDWGDVGAPTDSLEPFADNPRYSPSEVGAALRKATMIHEPYHLPPEIIESRAQPQPPDLHRRCNYCRRSYIPYDLHPTIERPPSNTSTPEYCRDTCLHAAARRAKAEAAIATARTKAEAATAKDAAKAADAAALSSFLSLDSPDPTPGDHE